MSTILVIVDQKLIRDSLKSVLKKEAYRVLTAENGERGLFYFEKDRKSVV
jgi:DNA-binding response OmpR family regulator